MAFVRDIIVHEMARLGITGMQEFLNKRGLARVYPWIKEGKSIVSVRILKNFCQRFHVDPNELEKKGIIQSPKLYPVNMSSSDFVRLKSHVLNEGRISVKKKSVGTLSYVNQDPVLLRYFANVIKGLGGSIRKELTFEGYGLAAYANPVLARALDFSGLPFGRKTRTNPPLDSLLRQNPELFRYHIQATLVEEGWTSLTISPYRRACLYIAWGRSVDIMAQLSSEQVNTIKNITEILRKRKIAIGNIKDYDLLNNIIKNPPLLFNQELFILSSTHKKKGWPEGHPTKIHLSKKGRITAFWEIHFTRPNLIDLIHDEYGMLPGTWKARRFEKLYEAYRKFRGRRLTDDEILEIRRVKDENPPEISVEWVSEKVQELFPEAEGARNLEKIRRMLGWKESE